jgi:hypothetical protein
MNGRELLLVTGGALLVWGMFQVSVWLGLLVALPMMWVALKG